MTKETPVIDPAEIAAARAAFMRTIGTDPKAWARRLAERDEVGERLTFMQRKLYREALGK